MRTITLRIEYNACQMKDFFEDHGRLEDEKDTIEQAIIDEIASNFEWHGVELTVTQVSGLGSPVR